MGAAAAPALIGPGEVNAYLSPPNAVSGRASTSPPSNFGGCTLTFNGPTAAGNPTVVLFARVTTTPNSNPTLRQPGDQQRRATRPSLLKGTITN